MAKRQCGPRLMPARVGRGWGAVATGTARRANKYGAERVTVDGIDFDSKREAVRYQELKIMERAGIIHDLRRQVRFDLMGADGPLVSDAGRKLHFLADFTYMSGGERIVEDAKGTPTPVYRVKKAILRAQGITVREV